jgi:hypothetical protein
MGIDLEKRIIVPMDSFLNHLQLDERVKKVAFFHSHIMWPSHFETDLELMDFCLRRDFEVISYVCNDHLKTCDQNVSGKMQQCANCISKRKIGLNLLDKNVREIPVSIKKIPFEFNPDSTVDEIKKLTYKNFDIGYAALSTIVSRYRDPYLTVRKYLADFEETISTGIALYNFFVKSLAETKPDLVFIFNGRYAYVRALLRACEFLGIEYYTHDRGANFSKFMLYPNTLPHDLNFFHDNMMRTWENPEIADETKIRIANAFYQDRVKGIEQGWFSFTAAQDQDALPPDWNLAKTNIGLFLSSEDEFIAIGDQWELTLFKNQIESLQYILGNVANVKNIHVYIRIHPNSNSAFDFIEKVKQFASKSVTVILPESSISTYKLLMNVQKVITFGSTVGIEATYWGKPSINIGNCFYKKVDATYNPKTKEETLAYILDETLSPIDKNRTYYYAYYVSTYGYTFLNYAPVNLMKGTYKNVNLNRYFTFRNRLLTRIVRRLLPGKARWQLDRLNNKFVYLTEVKKERKFNR